MGGAIDCVWNGKVGLSGIGERCGDYYGIFFLFGSGLNPIKGWFKSL